MIYILLPFVLVLIFWTIKFVYRIFRLGISHKKWFDDKLIQQLALAARRGQTKKMDKLIAQGANINYQGKEGMTILFWLIVSSSHGQRSKRGFVHLLKQENIDPTIFTSLKYFKKLYNNDNTAFNVIQMASSVIDSYYLKMILKRYKPTKEGLSMSYDELSPALIEAYESNNLTNFKILLKYGIDLTWENADGKGYVSRVNLGGDRWPFVYYTLKAGANYVDDVVKMKDNKMKIDLFRSIEDRSGTPTNIISCCHGIDYRQKVIDWLEKEKGVKLNPWMPKDQKYIDKDGEKTLMVQNKKGEWKEYKKTFGYFYHRYWICEDLIVRLFKKIWNTVYIGL